MSFELTGRYWITRSTCILNFFKFHALINVEKAVLRLQSHTRTAFLLFQDKAKMEFRIWPHSTLNSECFKNRRIKSVFYNYTSFTNPLACSTHFSVRLLCKPTFLNGVKLDDS